MSTPSGKPQKYFNIVRAGEAPLGPSVRIIRPGEPLPSDLGTRIVWDISPSPEGRSRGQHGLSLGESEELSVRLLARVLGQEPFRVVAELLKMGVLTSATQSVPLETAFTLLRQYGYSVERA
jgi:hypothetical protein